MSWILEKEMIEAFMEECGLDGEKWASKFNKAPKEGRVISLDFTCPVKKKKLNLEFSITVGDVKLTEV